MAQSKLFKKLKRRNLITYSFPESKVAEDFRTVRANVQIVTDQLKYKVLLVTSPNPGEGKSTIATNLAVSMVQHKEKVLLIDANIRHPQVHSIFNVSNSIGLTDVLMGKATFEEAVIRTEIDKLKVLSSGSFQTNSAELLTSYMMEELLQKAAEQYDKVLVDSSSILGVAGINLLASQCDGVLLVIGQGKTQLEQAAEAKKILEFSNAQIAGVILNEM